MGTAPKRCVAAARCWVSVSGSTCRSWLHASSALFGGGYRSFRYHGRWNGRSALPWAYSLTLFVFKSFRFPSCLYTSTPQPLLFGSPVPRDALFTDAVAGVTGRHGHERRILAFPTTGRVWLNHLDIPQIPLNSRALSMCAADCTCSSPQAPCTPSNDRFKTWTQVVPSKWCESYTLLPVSSWHVTYALWALYSKTV